MTSSPRKPGTPAAASALDEPTDDSYDVDAGSREHYVDAELYDYEYRRRRADIRFYRELATELLDGPGRILELACGTGRLTTSLLRDGHEVVASDISLPMLHRAQARIARLGRAARMRATLVCADARMVAFGETFALVAMAFNSFEHLYTRVEASACLQRVRDLLEPGGRFVFDVQNPNLRWLSRDADRRWGRTRFRHPTTGRRYEYTTNHLYDPVSQIVRIRLYYRDLGEDGDNERVVRLSQRKYFPAELETLLWANGFTIEARFGDFFGAPLAGESESQLIVCQSR